MPGRVCGGVSRVFGGPGGWMDVLGWHTLSSAGWLGALAALGSDQSRGGDNLGPSRLQSRVSATSGTLLGSRASVREE